MLDSFQLDSPHRLPLLTNVNVADNRIVSIHVGNLPGLQSLNVDCNRVAEIGGLDLLHDLQSISWRDQELDQTIPILRCGDCKDVHVLNLSRNHIPFFALQSPFLNLQRLELAFSSIEHLPEDFGTQMLNLRFLNLNHNGIRDIRPLLGIVRLVELHLVGNRIARLRRTTTVLSKLANSLEVFDCRANPLTVGFYDDSNCLNILEQQLVLQRSGNAIKQNEYDDNAFDTRNIAYLVPNANQGSDQEYRLHLDEGTTLKRYVYELLLFDACHSLSRLDGLCVERFTKLERGSIHGRLLELGVLKNRAEQDGIGILN